MWRLRAVDTHPQSSIRHTCQLLMSPFATRLLFVLACLAVPIVWGIVVNWIFQRLATTSTDEAAGSQQTEDEPTIEYYI